jgi:hypothetical protein
MLTKHGFAYFGATRSLSLIKALAQLYPPDGSRERIAGSRYFIRKVIATFDLNETQFFLNVRFRLHMWAGEAASLHLSKRTEQNCRLPLGSIF